MLQSVLIRKFFNEMTNLVALFGTFSMSSISQTLKKGRKKEKAKGGREKKEKEEGKGGKEKRKRREGEGKEGKG